MTSIEDKGDGVKSLAAISIVQSLTFEAAKGKSLVLCVEEPEAHLHPDAVHSLRNVLFEIASKAGVQVIISTHSPILVDRDHVSNNVVVYDNHRVSPCQSILDVRSVPVAGAITFKIMFEEGILPKVWPEARARKSRLPKQEETLAPEANTSGLQAALYRAEAEGQPVAEIAEAATQGAEITAELNGQELTITAQKPATMETAFKVTGDRRKTLVEAVSAFVGTPAVYQNAPTFAYAIGEYAVSKTGTLTGPANEALMAALNAKGFIVE